MRTEPCKGCRRKIGWIQTVTGKAMPVDPEKLEVRMLVGDRGAPRLTLITEGGVTYVGRVISQLDTTQGQFLIGYAPHWATCPNMDKFKFE